MRDAWSISGLASTFRLDRRTVSKYLDVGDVQPAPKRGPKGHPLHPLRDAVRVLVDAGYLASDSATDWREFGSTQGRETGARDLAERVLDAVAKRLDRAALRQVMEVFAIELHGHIGRLYDHEADPENCQGVAPNWEKIFDPELEAALRGLIEEGYLPAEDGAAG